MRIAYQEWAGGLAPRALDKGWEAAHLAPVAKGRFITFEGGEGAGKSTQARRLAERLRVGGREVVLTREPGGSPGAEAIRALLVDGRIDRWSPLTETLLMYAARRDHLETVIGPAVARGAWVVCDRFADSTRAYQGAGGGVAAAFIRDLEREVLEGAWPDLTLILDLPVGAGLARAAARGEAATRFEAQAEDFHQRLRTAFLAIAAAEPGRCAVIDAEADADTVAQTVWDTVQTRLSP